MDVSNLRNVFWDVLAVYAKTAPANRQEPLFLKEVARRLNAVTGGDSAPDTQVILTYWQDLFRNGYLAYGIHLDNPNRPWFFLTERGREALKHASRDPANPDGYLAHLHSTATLDPVAESYIGEALNTYNSNCFKATAVMVGAAAERLVLRLASTLAARLTATGKTVPPKLKDWQVKTVRDALTKELEAHKKDMPKELSESFRAYWMAFAEQARRVRNDAGHPESIDPVTPGSVHAALLIFPELAKLVADLETWVNKFFV
jgi:hypothetical protein